ncbi:hypothetical protein MRX96_001518 [Rhipicephalus microplus]|nr:glycoprotein 3-alpha-L-fucosyltransferase A-like [Rhipicephalus microplus]
MTSSAAAESDAPQPDIYFGSSLARVFNCAWNPGEEVSCEVTMHHSRVNDSDALVFYGESITASLLPKHRRTGQMWVFWATTDQPSSELHENISPISGLFNWTMGRRNDADVIVAYKTWYCGNAVRKDRNQEKMEAHMQKRKHRKDAAWIVGECERETFVNVSRNSMSNLATDHERERAIRVHLLTACGSKQCGSRRDCVRYIAQRYHFIVVSNMPECFQNASELIYDAFEHNVVPVVLEAEASLEFPPKSVISSSTMRGPGELAAYLRALIDNPKLYDYHFAWKDNCTVTPPVADGLCALCGALHEKPLRERHHSNVLDWWKRPKNCTDTLFSILSESFFVNE